MQASLIVAQLPHTMGPSCQRVNAIPLPCAPRREPITKTLIISFVCTWSNHGLWLPSLIILPQLYHGVAVLILLLSEIMKCHRVHFDPNLTGQKYYNWVNCWRFVSNLISSQDMNAVLIDQNEQLIILKLFILSRKNVWHVIHPAINPGHIVCFTVNHIFVPFPDRT